MAKGSGPSGDAMKYETQLDLTNRNNSQTQLVLLTGRDKKVLEVGPARGYVAQVLQERGCSVTGIEIDPEAARVAEQFCARMIIGDVEELSFKGLFGNEGFDVAVYGDVLEHLVHPDKVLEKTKAALKPGGYVVASIPNIAHGAIRLSLLTGTFRYTEMGLLDNTHLRFFTRETIAELFRDAGFVIKTWKRILIDPFSTEVAVREAEFPRVLVERLRGELDAVTYQYVVKAFLAPARPKSQARRPTVKGDAAIPRELSRYLSELDGQIGGLEEHVSRLDIAVSEARSESRLLRRKLRHRKRHIQELQVAVDHRSLVVEELEAKIAEKDASLAERDWRLGRYESSIGFRVLERARRLVDRLAPSGTRRRSLVTVLGRGVDVMVTEGPRGFLRRLITPWRWLPKLFQRQGPQVPDMAPPFIQGDSLNDRYQLWRWRHRVNQERAAILMREIESFAYLPTISVVMPTYNSDAKWLREAIDSVRVQVYSNWELCIADDGSTQYETRKLLRRIRRLDKRIKVKFLKDNRGIAGASNAALAMATGEFVGLLDHDDLLKPEALYEVVKAINEQRDLDYVYSDEDKVELDGKTLDPFFKPDWSPDLLMSVNYVTHFSVFRKELVDRIGGFREGYDGSQDYDLQLRISEQTERIHHIPMPLYSWRKVPGSAAASDTAKPYAYEAAKRALSDALERRGLKGEVEDGPFKGYYRIRYAIEGNPKVSIVIPTRDRIRLLKGCIDSIRSRSTYKNYEICIVNNRSRDPETLEYLREFDGRVIQYPEEFNYSRMNNLAAESMDGDFLLFLNNDTEVLSQEWIEALLEHAQRAEVASVGARLLYPDGTPQHEGIIVGPGAGLAGNVDTGGYFGLGLCVRNCAAVTGACMMVRTEVFRELGGFEERLSVAYQDVDFCLRAREKGYLTVFTPHAVLSHREGATRGRKGQTHPRENESFFRRRWGRYRDPYYSPNFDIDRPFVLRV